jgi:hypothetical protein
MAGKEVTPVKGGTAVVASDTGEMIELPRNASIPTSWAEAEKLIGSIVEFEGSPYQVTDKADLVGVPFMIVDIRVNPKGEFGEFVSVCGLVEDPDKRPFVINDGSTGLAEQAKGLVADGRKAGILVRGGLRVSEYMYEEKDFDGNPVIDPKTKKAKPPLPAKTYYLA